MSTIRTSARTLASSLRLLGVAAAVAGVGAFGVVPAAAPADPGTVVVTAAAKHGLPDKACKNALTKARPYSALYTRCDGTPSRF